MNMISPKIKPALHLIFLFYIMLVSFSTIAQDITSVEDLETQYSDYFSLSREHVFLHLNKTSILPSEAIWFSAYVTSSETQKPSATTVNLRVGLYDAEGNYYDSKTILIENGKGEGHFDLDTERYSSGDYILKASTGYMANFSEDLSFTQGFTIIGGATSSERQLGDAEKTTQGTNNAAKKTLSKFDLQLLPEGGHLVANTTNTIGVKLINQTGKGVSFSDGKIITTSGDIITTFESNRFGISKFTIAPKPDVTYLAELTTATGQVVTQSLPNAALKGLSLTANTLVPNATTFTVRANPTTAKLIADKRYYLALHQNGIIKTIPFTIDAQTLEKTIAIPHESLNAGINTVTVFNPEFEPILERMVFQDNVTERLPLNAQLRSKVKDSLVLGLTVNTVNEVAPVSMSVSILPNYTSAYNPNHNIFSAFYLKPYLRGALEDGAYYFNDQLSKRRRNYDLDLLLLTQGWSRYDWDEVFSNTPKETYTPDSGFSLKGKLTKRNITSQKYLIISNEDGSFAKVVPVEQNNSFKLDSLFLNTDMQFSFGIKDDASNKIIKPSLSVSVFPKRDSSDVAVNYKFLSEFREGDDVKSNQYVPEDFVRGENTLATVVIKADKQEEIYEPFKKSVENTGVTTKITEDIARRFTLILDYLGTQGFQVSNVQGVVSINSTRGDAAQVFLDDVLLQDLNLLSSLNISQVGYININRTALGSGLRTGGGSVIRIATRRGPLGYAREDSVTEKYTTTNGFATPKQFYAPKYASYTGKTFSNFGTIGWVSNVSFNNKTASFKVFNTLQPELNLYIEGITADGGFISKVIQVNTN